MSEGVSEDVGVVSEPEPEPVVEEGVSEVDAPELLAVLLLLELASASEALSIPQVMDWQACWGVLSSGWSATHSSFHC